MKQILIIIFVLAILGLGGWYLYLQIGDQNPASTTIEVPEQPSNVELLDDLYDDRDSEFVKAEKAFRADNYEEAQQNYAEALANTDDDATKAHIQYRLARVTEQIDPIAAIEEMKKVIANPDYPDVQKKYAAMWIPIIVSRHHYKGPETLEAALAGEPYSSFRIEDSYLGTLINFHKYALEFGPTGVSDFMVARGIAEDINNGKYTNPAEQAAAEAEFMALIDSGNDYIREARTDERNSGLIPRILRERARANAILAFTGNELARNNFHQYYEEAITQGLASKLDGPIRFDYFRFGYVAFGEESFVDTEPHLLFLLSNIEDYVGVKRWLEREKDNAYGGKERMVAVANANPTFKTYLLNQAGWTEDDF